MLKSNFRLWVWLAALLALFITGVLIADIYYCIYLDSGMPLLAVIVFTATMFLSWIWIVFGELRTKMIRVKLFENKISVSGYGGLGPEKTYTLSDFDGYITADVPSKYATYEFLYLIKDFKKVVKLSEFYHSNYRELKLKISEHMRYIGNEKFKMKRELKEIFK